MLIITLRPYIFGPPNIASPVPWSTAGSYETFNIYIVIALPFPVWFQQPFHNMLIHCAQRRAFWRTFFSYACVRSIRKEPFGCFSNLRRVSWIVRLKAHGGLRTDLSIVRVGESVVEQFGKCSHCREGDVACFGLSCSGISYCDDKGAESHLFLPLSLIRKSVINEQVFSYGGGFCLFFGLLRVSISQCLP